MEKEFNTQQQEIIDYMAKHGGITSLQAVEDLKVLRLASRISELIKKGFPIVKENIYYTKENGRKCHYVKYSLEE